MDKFEIIKRAFNQEPTERIPYSLWKHFPEFDKTPEGLRDAQVKFQEKFNSDIMKISVHSKSFVVDFGSELGGYNPVSGSRLSMKDPISNIEDWESIEPVDPNEGEFGRQIRAVKLISDEIGGKVPSMITVFSPLMVANKMDPSILKHARENPGLISEQLTMLTSVMAGYSKACLDAGANGIFLATQHFTPELTDEEREHLEFDPMKELIKNGIKGDSFVVLHLHGDEPDFPRAIKLPSISAINWHDQHTTPDLPGARNIFSGGLLGGLDSASWKENSKVEDITSKIRKLKDGFPGDGLILAPGCVIPQYVTDDILSYVVGIIKNL
ncbi:MAG: uroporphyrinogen decarboxylase family protein [Candidatus Hodarchaeota archaeon]